MGVSLSTLHAQHSTPPTPYPDESDLTPKTIEPVDSAPPEPDEPAGGWNENPELYQKESALQTQQQVREVLCALEGKKGNLCRCIGTDFETLLPKTKAGKKLWTQDQRTKFFQRANERLSSEQKNFLALTMMAYGRAGYTGDAFVPGANSLFAQAVGPDLCAASPNYADASAPSGRAVAYMQETYMTPLKNAGANPWASVNNVKKSPAGTNPTWEETIFGPDRVALPQALVAMCHVADDVSGPEKCLFEHAAEAQRHLAHADSEQQLQPPQASDLGSGSRNDPNVLVAQTASYDNRSLLTKAKNAIKRPLRGMVNAATTAKDLAKSEVAQAKDLIKKPTQREPADIAALKGKLTKVATAAEGLEHVKDVFAKIPKKDQDILRRLGSRTGKLRITDDERGEVKRILNNLPLEDATFLSFLFLGHGEAGAEKADESIPIFQLVVNRTPKSYGALFLKGNVASASDMQRAYRVAWSPSAFSSLNQGQPDLKKRILPGLIEAIDGKNTGEASAFKKVIAAYSDWTMGRKEVRNFGILKPDGTFKPNTHNLNRSYTRSAHAAPGMLTDWAWTRERIDRQANSLRARYARRPKIGQSIAESMVVFDTQQPYVVNIAPDGTVTLSSYLRSHGFGSEVTVSVVGMSNKLREGM